MTDMCTTCPSDVARGTQTPNERTVGQLVSWSWRRPSRHSLDRAAIRDNHKIRFVARGGCVAARPWQRVTAAVARMRDVRRRRRMVMMSSNARYAYLLTDCGAVSTGQFNGGFELVSCTQ